MIEKLNQIGYKKVIWILAISETIHNFEEAIWLPEWSKAAGVWHPKVGATEFRIAVFLITVMFYVVIYYFSKNMNSTSTFLMGGALVIVLFNVLMPHLLATVLTLNYVPGVITGVLLNVPVTLYLLKRGLQEELFTVKKIVLSGVFFAGIAFPLIQLFFAVGRIMSKVI